MKIKFLLLGTSLSLISNVSYGNYINEEALYALPEELGRVGEGVKENSSIVFARRTLSDAAIQSTHPNPLYQEREYRKQATAFLPLIGKAGVEKQSGGLFFADRRRLVSLQRSDSDQSRRYNRVTDASVSAARRMSRKISQHKGLEASRLLLPEQDSADLPLTASVCFITDAGHCRENEFYTGANTPDGSSGGTPGGSSSGGDEDGDNWEVDNEEKCKKEGYTNEDCGETATPGTPCLYDSSYHAGCVCKPEYNQTCSGADEAGKGASCDGKYKECCSLCSAYPYSDGTIPAGHVVTETCQSCTGAKYKTKCNTNSSNTGAYVSCGSATGSGSVCSDDSGKYYEKCTCPTNYEFNAQTQSCVCKTNFKYTCTGTGYAGGTGTSCGNKYQTCNCASGYTWSASSGCVKCSSSFKYTCTGSNQTKPSSGCGGKYDKCNCKSGYEWSGGSCIAECSSSYKYSCTGTGYAGGAGSACGGKYTQCTCASGYKWNGSACIKETCSSSYKYTCTGTGYAGGSGSACDGKYASCTCSSDYAWKNGSCQQKITDGPAGDLYYCDGEVVGVKAPGMDFYIATSEMGKTDWMTALAKAQRYLFCWKTGNLPTVQQIEDIYYAKSILNNLLSKYGGTELKSDKYWTMHYDNYARGALAIDISSSDLSGFWSEGGKDNCCYVRPVLDSY